MAAEPATEKPVEPTPADASPAVVGPAPEKPRRASRAGFGRRLTIGTNVLLQIALLAFILLCINGYAFKHYHRFDLSRDHRSTLSDRTKQFLHGLDKPVKIIVLISERSPLQGDVASLAAEYRNAQSKYVTLDVTDPFRDYNRAAELQTKYKLAQQENVVILDCEGRTKIIGLDKLAEIDPGNEMTQTAPQVTAFTGEQAITAGLIEVTEGKKSTVYYVQGHGEPSLAAGKPYAPIGDQLTAEHLTVGELNLLNADAVPADATVVMLMGPHYDLTDREVKLLSDYWDKGGRLLVLLNPEFPTPHLAGFLTHLGVRPDDDRILGVVNALGVRRLISSALTLFAGDTSIAMRLSELTPLFAGSTQSLSITPEAGTTAGLKVGPLLVAAKGFWGEVDYKDMENTGADNDPAKDKQAPLFVAATVEKGAVGDQRVQVTPSRMIVFGNARFVDPETMDEQMYTLFINSINWLGEREALIGIPPKQVKATVLSIPEERVNDLFKILIFYIPGVCAFLGIVVWWWRRRS